jgi:hypothetical protein
MPNNFRDKSVKVLLGKIFKTLMRSFGGASPRIKILEKYTNINLK